MSPRDPAAPDEPTTPLGAPLKLEVEPTAVAATPLPKAETEASTAPTGPVPNFEVAPPTVPTATLPKVEVEPTAVAATPLPKVEPELPKAPSEPIAATGPIPALESAVPVAPTAVLPTLPPEPTAVAGKPLSALEFEPTRAVGLRLNDGSSARPLLGSRQLAFAASGLALLAAVTWPLWLSLRPPAPELTKPAPPPTLTVLPSPDPVAPPNDEALSRASARTWKCAQIAEVGGLLRASAGSPWLFTISFADEARVVVTTRQKDPPQSAAKMRAAIAKCKGTAGLLEARQVNDRFEGVWAGRGKVHGFEVKLDALSVRRAAR